MRTNRLTILAALSLALLAVLLCGYFATFGPECVWFTPINAATATWHDVEIKLDRGGFFIQTENIPLNTGSRVPTGFHFEPVFANANPGLPRARRALWEFCAGPNVGTTTREFCLAFPNWCLALPCTIAPLQWLRRSRRPREPHGFPVEQRTAQPAVPSERDAATL